MNLSSDKQCNPALKKEMQSLRKGVVGVAEQQNLPTRFQVEPDKDRPHMHITDTVTGKTVDVPLFSYREVRHVLDALFPNEMEE